MGRRLIAALAVIMAGVLAIGTSFGLWLGTLDDPKDGGPRRRDATPLTTGGPNASRLHEGVVLIETEGAGEGGVGTGMIITPDGLVITNYHVVEYGLSVEVQIGLTGQVFDAEVLGFDRAVDIALLQLEGASNLPTVQFSHEVAVGETLTAVGNANGQGFLSDHPGTVTGVDQSIWVSEDPFTEESLRMEGLIATDAEIAGGCSGGPVFNKDGFVVGVTVAGGDSKFPEGFSIPAEDAQQVVDTILAGADSGTTRVGPWGSLGALVGDPTGVSVSTMLTTQATGSGAEIINMQSPSPARDAGMEIGDVIKAFDGELVENAYDLYTALKLYEPGDVVTVTYVDSGGTKVQVDVELMASTSY